MLIIFSILFKETRSAKVGRSGLSPKKPGVRKLGGAVFRQRNPECESWAERSFAKETRSAKVGRSGLSPKKPGVRKLGGAVFRPRSFGARAKNNFRTPFSKTIYITVLPEIRFYDNA